MILCNYFYPKDKKLVIEKKNPLKTKENKVSSLMHTCMEQTISCQALVSYQVSWFECLASQVPCWCIQSFLADATRVSNSGGNQQPQRNKEKTEFWRQEMLILQVLPVFELLKFIRTQLTLYKQKRISLHSIFKFSRGNKGCKQAVLGINSIVHGECMLHSHACAEKLNSQSRI